MAQRQAQVDDVRWSRLQTELASSQNLSIMVFTVMTVVFLPLSFFTSLFGMNTAEWDANFPDFAYIGSISLPISAFLIIGSLVAAFSSRVQVFFLTTFKYIRKIFGAAREIVEKLEPEARRMAKMKKREVKDEMEYQSRRSKEKSYDFWATVRRQRNSEYHIPDLNRKSSGRRGMTPRQTWKTEAL